MIVDRWSTGDFSTFAKDSSSDEVGQLSQQLNRMAEQLQNVLETRHQLAVLEERNRLARDLHDSVKQQIFATTMQVRAAKKLMVQNAPQAQSRLDEAEELLRQTQQEMTSLINELRPLTLEEKGLPRALQELIDRWSRRTEISAHLHFGELLPVTPSVEEALSNVLRHSQAHNVQLLLNCDQQMVTLCIVDDGKCFELETKDGRGVGLRSMRERLEPLGGQLAMQSKPESDTTLVIRCEREPVLINQQVM